MIYADVSRNEIALKHGPNCGFLPGSRGWWLAISESLPLLSDVGSEKSA
jgi:hypothetical protein